jgi:hypothetical protein
MQRSQHFCHFLNASWKSCSVRVFSLDNLNCVKVAAFQFYLQLRKQRKVRWVETRVVLFLVKNSLVTKEVLDDALS